MESYSQALNGTAVSPDYDVGVYIGGQAYKITSPDGRLQMEAVSKEEIFPKLGKWSRVTVDSQVIADRLATAEDQETELKKLEAQWAISAIGDPDQLKSLQKELKPHSSRLQQVIFSAAGPCASCGRIATSDSGLACNDDGQWYCSACAPNIFDLPVRTAETDTKAGSQERREAREAYKEVFAKNLEWTQPLKEERNCQRWVLFSAGSTWFGNLGQANYVACNAMLDMVTWQRRQQYFSSLDSVILWGAVSGIGMRWKAFASADAMGLQAEDTRFTIRDAQMIIYSLAVLQSPQEAITPLNISAGDLRKGQGQGFLENTSTYQGGGYIDDGEDIDIDYSSGRTDGTLWVGGLFKHWPHPAAVKREAELIEQGEHLAQRAFDEAGGDLLPGAHVRLTGWKNRHEMNGLTGTLVRQTKEGLWRVKFDNGSKDKLIHPKYVEIAPYADEPAVDNTVLPNALVTPENESNISASSEAAPALTTVEEDDEADSDFYLAGLDLAPGVRVCIVCWSKRPEMNGTIGTLKRQTRDGKWVVQLEADHCEKLLPADLLSIAPEALQPHTYVRLHILKTTPEFNGLEGTCVKLDVETGRWLIHIHSWGAEAAPAAFRTENLLIRKTLPPAGQPECPADPTPSVRRILQEARPNWSDKDLDSVLEKLAKANVCTAGVLYSSLRRRGLGNLNEKLRQAGERCFTTETLQALFVHTEGLQMRVCCENSAEIEALTSLLQAARPDWQAKELDAIHEKLAKVNITTYSSMVSHLNGSSLNEMLKRVGEKGFTASTLQALRQQATKFATTEKDETEMPTISSPPSTDTEDALEAEQLAWHPLHDHRNSTDVASLSSDEEPQAAR